MSKIRGFVPLFLATAFGIANGLAVFQPAFLDQQRQKQEEQGKEIQTVESPETADIETGKEVRVATSDHVANNGSAIPTSDGENNTRASTSHP